MTFNQTTLRIIANGDYMPDKEYIQAMAKALIENVVIYPDCSKEMRNDGLPYWYIISKGGVDRGTIYHAAFTNTFLVEIDYIPASSFGDLSSAEEHAKKILK